jgi:molybdate transport system ATP-binding protein
VTLVLDARLDVRGVQVEFEVGTGETLALLGPNGSGKSTCIGIASGVLVPDDGRVALDGTVLTDVGPGRRLVVPPHARRTASLTQEALLFPHLDVLDNVGFGPRSRGEGRSSSRRSAQRWLDELGVGDLARRRPASLSGGQAQRVAVARALAAEPRLLLLDEPMAALDVAVQPSLRQTLRRVLADKTVVLVTHDPLDALMLADRVVVLEAGRVVEAGDSRTVLSRPRSSFAAQLAGVNWVDGTWDGRAVRTPAGQQVHGLVDGDPPQSGDRTVAIFRPQSVAVYPEPVAGSPRNNFDVTISDIEPLGDRIRVHADGLSADVTVQAAAALNLEPGVGVTFVVKATEVTVYRL